jgi:hypothetical protein
MRAYVIVIDGSADTKGILIVMPGVSWRPVNFVITTVMLVWISHRVAWATGESTDLICGIQAKHELPTASSFTIANLSTREQALTFDESGQASNEESIPLVQPVSRPAANTLERGEQVALSEGDKMDGEAASSQADMNGLQDSSGTSYHPRVPELDEEGTDAPITRSTPLLSPLGKWFEPPLKLPVRMAGILVTLWLLNVLWPVNYPSSSTVSAA